MSDHSFDACLRLVADRCRRQIIQQLRSEPGGVARFDELVELLHGDGGDGDREQLGIELQHTHLPKLADHGVVEYDRRSGTIRYHPIDRVETVLDSLPEEASQSDESPANGPRCGGRC